MKVLFLAISLLLFTSCQTGSKSQSPNLSEVLQGNHRSDKNKSRDKYRHPAETLAFFGVEPNSTVVEISPGGGWYAEILAPYLKNGTLYLAAFSKDSERKYFQNANAKLKKAMDGLEGKTGKVHFTEFETPKIIGPIAPKNSADHVLTFRNVHNWMKAGKVDEAFKEFHRVLKPGGVLGVVEHRASSKSKKDPEAKSGYVHEDVVIAIAEKAGFKLVAKSEINANPKDKTMYKGGVWTLPPVLRNKDKDRDKYMAIGESDRMTLKFIKTR